MYRRRARLEERAGPLEAASAAPPPQPGPAWLLVHTAFDMPMKAFMPNAVTAVLLGCARLGAAQTAHLATAECPADGAGLTHVNSVYDAAEGAGTPTAGPKLPNITSRPTRTYGAVGSCVGSAAEGFDGGEIVVGATIPLYGPRATSSYAKIMRFTIEIFLDWLNHERVIPDQEMPGGLIIGGKRYAMRFVWTDDKQEAAEAALALATSTRRSNAHFGWGGYGSTISRLQAEQAELDGYLFMASIAADVRVFANRSLTFGALPPDYTYIKNAVKAVADAATGADGIPGVDELKVGLVYQAPLDGMCAEIAELAVDLGMTVASSPWRGDGRNGVPRHPTETPGGEESVDSVLSGLRDDGVNFVVGCVYHDGGEAIIESLERLDYSPHAAAFTSTVDISAYQSRVDAGWWQGEYALGVSPWHSSLTHRGEFSGMTSAEYVERYQSRTGEKPSYHGPASFSAACALAKAIEDAGSLNATDVATSLQALDMLELGFYSPMNLSANGQNAPEMLVVQYPPGVARSPSGGAENLTIVYPAEVESSSRGDLHFPMPPWGLRRCRNLGSGVTYGAALPTDLPTTECSGNGRCVLDRSEDGHEVYECECDALYFGKWLKEDCDLHILDVWAVIAYVFTLALVALCVGLVVSWLHNEKLRRSSRHVHKRIVVSCPEMGTLDEDGGKKRKDEGIDAEQVYDQKVMDYVKGLVNRPELELKFGFDHADSSTTEESDKALFTLFAETKKKEHVQRTRWWYGYCTAVKRCISLEAQNFEGLLELICIEGGPITAMEAEEVPRLLVEAAHDADHEVTIDGVDNFESSWKKKANLSSDSAGSIEESFVGWAPRDGSTRRFNATVQNRCEFKISKMSYRDFLKTVDPKGGSQLQKLSSSDVDTANVEPGSASPRSGDELWRTASNSTKLRSTTAMMVARNRRMEAAEEGQPPQQASEAGMPEPAGHTPPPALSPLTRGHSDGSLPTTTSNRGRPVALARSRSREPKPEPGPSPAPLASPTRPRSGTPPKEERP